jgi:hypothetical protein
LLHCFKWIVKKYTVEIGLLLTFTEHYYFKQWLPCSCSSDMDALMNLQPSHDLLCNFRGPTTITYVEYVGS